MRLLCPSPGEMWARETEMKIMRAAKGMSAETSSLAAASGQETQKHGHGRILAFYTACGTLHIPGIMMMMTWSGGHIIHDDLCISHMVSMD